MVLGIGRGARAALAGLIATALWTGALAQTAEREALLERLAGALPDRETPLTLNSSLRYATLRARLLHEHPDREADIDAVFSRLATCLQIEGDALSNRLLIEAVDDQLTDAEIGTLVTFYEGPDYPRLDAFVHRLTSSPDLPPAEERAWAEQQITSRPELNKFAHLVIQVGRDSPGSSEAEEIIQRCGDAAIDELRAAGLSN